MDREVTPEEHIKFVELRMWSEGHSWQEIREMSAEDFFNIVGWWHENKRADDHEEEERKALGGSR